MVAGKRRSAERFEVPSEVGRQRRVDLDALLGERVREREAGRMQELAPEGGLGDAVDGVADDREVDRGEVDADLVRPPRLEADVEERVARVGLDRSRSG